MQINELKKLQILVKQAAQEELLKDFGRSSYQYKADGSVITPADLAMQNRLEKELKQLWPYYPILGEEMSEQQQQNVIDNAQTYWCIDPLDGTSNYAAGLPFFAVSIALITNNKQKLGLIYDPVRDELFSAVKGHGAYLNDKKLNFHNTQFEKNKPIIAEIDLKRLPTEIVKKVVTERKFASQRNLGSSAIDWCWMSAGRFDVYLHGAQKLWDYAAGSLIFSEAGGHSVSLDNHPVFGGKLESRSILASFDYHLFEQWAKWLEIPINLKPLHDTTTNKND